ncbi:MAG TPA: maleylpyruvate isomerase family mycothiol-dependent enzyme [Candidatus Dormibacteraeota bacterium]|jgi:uncharacterized protein (TIGR03083 family)|nr:maleylpyruvate isomerase family mycothiol-dependent enzyme [Candidatus Dormibacteraeota bacterium]
MSTTAATLSPRAAARRPALDRGTAMRLAANEYTQFVDQLRGLSASDWTRPTPCPAWDVHAMACHVLGMAEMAASPVEQVRQMVAARRRGGLFIDALTALQVDKHVHRSSAEVVQRLEVATHRAARGRARTPSLIRRARMGNQPVGDDGTQMEPWTVGYLTDVILTRDTWIHRADVAAATERPMTLSTGHDGVIVADVVAEWAGRHAQPCTLTLTGPAGGSWSWGDGGPSYQLDPVRFCRILSGRAPGDGLLSTRVPF